MKNNGWVLSLIAIIIASVSAAFTGYMVYTDYLSDFNPALTTDSVGWKIERDRLALVVPIVFSNQGARPGVIKEIRLVLHIAKVAAEYKFFPAFYVSPSYVKGMPMEPSLMKYLESPFVALFLQRREKVLKTILFLPREKISADRLSEGEYKITFEFWTDLMGPKTTAATIKYEMDNAKLDVLKKGMLLYILSKDRDILRQKP